VLIKTTFRTIAKKSKNIKDAPTRSSLDSLR